MNFYQQLEQKFRDNAQGSALLLPGDETWDYAGLLSVIDDIALKLLDMGLQRGQRVLVQVEKSPENLALYLAALKVGLVYVPLNTAYTEKELEYFIEDSQPALYVGAHARTDVPSAQLRSRSHGCPLISTTLFSSVETGPPPTEVLDSEQLAAILYTSGTTGRSKGAMLSHGNLAANAEALCSAWGWREDDVLLHALPIFHVHGLFIASHCALLMGTPMVFLPRFDAAEVLQWLPKATVMMGVPTFYTRLLALSDLDAQRVQQIRLFICGSAPLTEQTFLAWEAATGHRILERYGMSETIINTTNPLEGDRQPGTVGFALPGLELRIANDASEAVPVGEIGTIEVRGPSVFSGYWRMPEKTRQEIREDGFFITGDLGRVDEGGRVSIVGRAKDLVISGGFNVYPKEVEVALDKMPEVSEAAVIGVAHPDFGEAVVAVVVPHEQEVTLEQVDRALADTLARFKQPKAVFNLSELPRNAMGKVQKNLLRDAYANTFSDDA